MMRMARGVSKSVERMVVMDVMMGKTRMSGAHHRQYCGVEGQGVQGRAEGVREGHGDQGHQGLHQGDLVGEKELVRANICLTSTVTSPEGREV